MTLTPAGWTFMILAWSTILGFAVWCMRRILFPSKPGEKEEA